MGGLGVSVYDGVRGLVYYVRVGMYAYGGCTWRVRLLSIRVGDMWVVYMADGYMSVYVKGAKIVGWENWKGVYMWGSMVGGCESIWLYVLMFISEWRVCGCEVYSGMEMQRIMTCGQEVGVCDDACACDACSSS